MKNVFVCVVFLIILALSSTLFAAESSLKDDEKWARPSVERIGLTQQIEGSELSAEITRGEYIDWIVKIWKLKGGNESDGAALLDVKKENPYYKSIQIAVHNKLILGKDPQHIYPYHLITREELALIATRVSKHLGKHVDGKVEGVTPFKDDSHFSKWAKDSIYKLVQQKTISGYPDGNFYPHQYSTKAEAAVLLDRIMHQKAYKDLSKEKAVSVDGQIYQYKRHLSMRSTAYGPHVGSRTATGKRVRFGMIAVDPKVIPLGTKLYVTGYQSPYLPADGFLAVAEDTGGAVKGNKIDIFINQSRRNLLKYGVQQVEVYILK